MALVPTARGDEIDAADMGFTSASEEVVGVYQMEVDFNWPHLSLRGSADPAVQEQIKAARIKKAVDALNEAKAVGVDTIVDRVIPGIGRNVPWVKEIAAQTEVNIIVATGWYTWRDLPPIFELGLMFPDAFETKPPRLADVLVQDIEEGVPGTGVKAGIIKFASDHLGINEGVQAIIAASAEAHRRTGAPITTHSASAGDRPGILSIQDQQAALEKEGVDLRRIQFGHADYTPPEVPIEEFVKVLDKGSFIGFDTVALGHIFPFAWEQRISRIIQLCEMGYSAQILLGNDDYPYTDCVPEIPERPLYTDVKLKVVPALLERGLSEEHATEITVDNPRRLFEMRDLGAY
ncbi:phosphotriesterase family protein [Dietzia lutea]|nr:phosphotriesterase-related protein [Dietzia lutea]